MNWNEAKSWVEHLNVDDGVWRMPTIDELRGLYRKDMGSHNITPLLKATAKKYLWVWSGETEGQFAARTFLFNFGINSKSNRSSQSTTRTFAVRHRKD